MKILLRVGVGIMLVATMGAGAHATQTDNHGLHAVPTTGAVVTDGKLNDWDLSGQTLMCYDVETLRDTYSAQVAMMYDRDNLYVSLHWKSPHPLGNHHDPHYQADKGWAADAVQLRFKTDRIAHVTAWYYVDRHEPAIQIEYGKSLTEPFGGGSVVLYQTAGAKLTHGAEMAFKEDPDGRGYVQEMKLPWNLLTQNTHYHAGDIFHCGIELLWGTADFPEQRYADNLMPGKTSREFFWTAYNDWGPVTLEPHGRLHLPNPAWMAKVAHPDAAVRGPVALSYTLPRDGRVTLIIEDAQGRRIRNLIPALPRKKGPNTEYWDGLDDDGKAVPPGTYRYRGIYHDPIHLTWDLSFNSPGNPSWATSDGRGAYYGDHTAPHAVATAGDYVALACPIGEGGQPLIGCDLTGQRLWGQANRQAFAGGIQSLATDGKVLWVAAEDTRSYIYRVEIATGLYAPWKKTARDEQGQPYRVLDLPVGATPAAQKPAAANDASAVPAVPDLAAIAERNGILAVCLEREGSVELLNSDTGAVKAVYRVPKPRSVALDSDGSAIVLSEGRLIRISAGGRRAPFTAAVYPDAHSLAIDGAGNVYLSVRGADQNVKVFSPDGRLLREIGKRGGRPANGPYDPGGMLNPAQIAVDRMGRLWVTEENDNPKRTSVWGPDGKLVKDLVGTGHYSSAGALNPFEPSMGFADNTIYKIDWKTGTSRPVYSLAKRDDPADLFGPRADSHVRVVKHNGLLYVYDTDSARGADEVYCTLFDGKTWRAAAHTGTVHRKEPLDQWAKYASPLFDGHDGEAYAWADRNGDGLVQADELQFSNLTVNGKPTALRSYYWGQLPDSNGAIIYMAEGTQSLLRFPITGYTPCGAPIYNIAHPTVTTLDQPLLGLGNGEGMLMGGSDGRVYINQDPILCVDRNGRVLGTYPSHFTSVHGSHEAKAARPGYIIGPSSITGMAPVGRADEVFDLNGNLGEHYLFTSDGLLVQSLFKDLRGGYDTPDRAVRGEPFDNTTAGGESFGANLIGAPDGRVFLTIGGTDARVLDVSGLNTLRRLPTRSFTYTARQYDQAVKLAQNQTAHASAPKSYTIARVTTPVILDGRPDDWPELNDPSRTVMEIQDSPDQRYGRVAARYDADALYVGYRVFAPRSAMLNDGQDKLLLFKTGDAVDLMLGPQPDRKGAGDVRVLMTIARGQPVAMVYRKVVPGAPAANRVPFAAPWHTIYFDRVGAARDAQIATGPIEGGYFVEARIPWKDLGVQPKPGLKLRGDVGILFAENGGRVTVSRQYWSNKATGLVNDIPGEADLTPNLWGAFVLE